MYFSTFRRLQVILYDLCISDDVIQNDQLDSMQSRRISRVKNLWIHFVYFDNFKSWQKLTKCWMVHFSVYAFSQCKVFSV